MRERRETNKGLGRKREGRNQANTHTGICRLGDEKERDERDQKESERVKRGERREREEREKKEMRKSVFNKKPGKYPHGYLPS